MIQDKWFCKHFLSADQFDVCTSILMKNYPSNIHMENICLKVSFKTNGGKDFSHASRECQVYTGGSIIEVISSQEETEKWIKNLINEAVWVGAADKMLWKTAKLSNETDNQCYISDGFKSEKTFCNETYAYICKAIKGEINFCTLAFFFLFLFLC